MQVEVKVFGLGSKFSSSCFCYKGQQIFGGRTQCSLFHPTFLALLVLPLQKKDLAPSPGSLPLILKAEMGEQIGGLSKALQF